MDGRDNPPGLIRRGSMTVTPARPKATASIAALAGGALRRPARALLSGLAVLVVSAAVLTGASAYGTASAPPPCAQPPQDSQFPPPSPTTVTTIGQVYYCIIAHYYSGPVLDDRLLLTGAFAGLIQQLDRLNADQPDATLPALTDDHDSDWGAFATVYQQITRTLSARDQQDAAAATITGMVDALQDNHARWTYPSPQPPGATPDDTYGLGISTSPGARVPDANPGEALPPLFVTAVDKGSPADHAGIRPGDVITAVNGAPPFTDNTPSPGVFHLLNQSYPQQQALRITLRWPPSGATRALTLTPATYPASPPTVTTSLLDGDIAQVTLPEFFSGATDQVLTAITNLEKTTTLNGIILDLRGNGGGAVPEATTLIGAFEHGTPWSYSCTVTDQCTANYPDSTTPLLHLPLAILTDRGCASACDAFSGAVKDLHLGTLIGTRTAGAVSGPATNWVLNDGSELLLPAQHHLSANREIINGIGVAPDYYIPLTPEDLATGHDPDIIKALAVLNN